MISIIRAFIIYMIFDLERKIKESNGEKLWNILHIHFIRTNEKKYLEIYNIGWKFILCLNVFLLSNRYLNCF